MAYIRCASCGGGAVEVITGTITGASGATEAGRVTVTSQQGKTVKRAYFWNGSHTGAEIGAGSVTWCDNYTGGCFSNVYYSNKWNLVHYLINATAQLYNSKVSAVTTNSITFQCPTQAAYYTGTWYYSVEFE